MTCRLRNQDYKARVRMLTISDTIAIKAGNEPIVGVKVTADPGGQSVMTDSKGRYAIHVPYGWTGRLIFSKEDMVFDPDNKPFTNVTSNIVNGQSQPSSERPPYNRAAATPSRPPVALPTAAGNVFVIPTAQVVPEKVAETAEDLRIMLQILRDKLSEPRMIRGAFVNFGDFFGDRDRALEAFYLQGSAAVFVLEMDSPFAFAPVPPGAGRSGERGGRSGLAKGPARGLPPRRTRRCATRADCRGDGENGLPAVQRRLAPNPASRGEPPSRGAE